MEAERSDEDSERPGESDGSLGLGVQRHSEGVNDFQVSMEAWKSLITPTEKDAAFCAPLSPFYDLSWEPWEFPDQPFRNYRPFPEWDRAEAQARAAVGRAKDAWSVLRGRSEVCTHDPYDYY